MHVRHIMAAYDDDAAPVVGANAWRDDIASHMWDQYAAQRDRENGAVEALADLLHESEARRAAGVAPAPQFFQSQPVRRSVRHRRPTVPFDS